MSTSVFALVLLGAVLHASWNAIVKGAGDKLVSAAAICLWAAVISGLFLPFVTQPDRASWPYLAVSVALQTTYFSLVAAAYGRSDLSQAYPIMRGGAPLIVAAAMTLYFDEALPLAGWGGILLISGGILSMAVFGRSGPISGLGYALANAVIIALYTLNDGMGARASGAAIGYTLWLGLLTAPPFFIVAILFRGPGILGQALASWRNGILGGIGTMGSYGVALWAMVLAPVAMVAALRETSILFAIAISALFLGERIGRARIAAVALIAAGAVVLRIA